MPTIVDEILNSKSPREIRNLEKRIFRDDRSSLETLMPSEALDSYKQSILETQIPQIELVPEEEYFKEEPDLIMKQDSDKS